MCPFYVLLVWVNIYVINLIWYNVVIFYQLMYYVYIHFRVIFVMPSALLYHGYTNVYTGPLNKIQIKQA